MTILTHSRPKRARGAGRGRIHVLHVAASAQRRGSQVFLSDLARALDDAFSQHVAVLHRIDGPALGFSVPTTFLVPRDRRPRWPVLDPLVVRRLRRLVRCWRPDVIHAHGGEPLKYAVAAVVGDDVPIIYRRIGSSSERTLRNGRRGLYRILMRRAAVVVAVSASVRTETIRVFGLDPRRVVTILNAADSSRIAPSRSRREVRRELDVPPLADLIVSVGAFTWEKDPIGQLEVVRRVAKGAPDAILLMVGDGPMHAELEGAIPRLGLEGRVRLVGVRDDVADLLAASDLLLLASSTEGLPGIAIEAGMSGLPVVGYSIGGVDEVVIHGQTGLLAAPGDLDDLATALLTLIDDREQRAMMSRRAREWCASRFDIRVAVQQYEDLYRQTLDLR